MTEPIKLKGRMRSITRLAATPQDTKQEGRQDPYPPRRGNFLTFSVHTTDKIGEAVQKLISRNIEVELRLAGNGDASQIELPLADDTPKEESRTIVIPGEVVLKPIIRRSDLKGEPSAPVALWWQFNNVCADAADGLLPRLIERAELRFYIPMPDSWDTKKRLQHDGKPHFQRPRLHRLVEATLDSLLGNGEIVAEVTAAKFWTNGDGYTEVTFS